VSQLEEAENPLWGPTEVEAWWAKQDTNKRSYQKDVVARLKNPRKFPSDKFDLQQYGALSADPERYPLYRVTTKKENWNPNNPTILITGGVHGYEPSGIRAALHFLEKVAPKYADKINFVVYPCVSPIGYEIDHRWNRQAQDPNRHFRENGKAEESLQLMASLKQVKAELLHDKRFRFAIDLHETNNRDIELIAERHARDGTSPKPEDKIIPNGFYLCVTKEDDVSTGQKIVRAVKKVTAICADDKIIGYPNQEGVIVLNDVKGLCQGFTSTMSDMAMTTEIYPDKITAPKARKAQLAVIKKAIALTLNPS